MLLSHKRDSKALYKSWSEIGGLVDGSESYPVEQTTDLGLFFPVRMIEIIGFKLTTKG